jgi:hypothetical protein
MSQFTSLVAQYGIETFLQHSHALVVWIEKNGNLLAWNPAFGFFHKCRLAAGAGLWATHLCFFLLPQFTFFGFFSETFALYPGVECADGITIRVCVA